MSIVIKSFDDAVYVLVPIDLPSLAPINYDDYASLLDIIPADLPGVISHSGSPDFPKPGCTFADHSYPAYTKEQMMLFAESWVAHALSSKQKPFCPDCGKKTPVDSVHTCSPQAGEAKLPMNAMHFEPSGYDKSTGIWKSSISDDVLISKNPENRPIQADLSQVSEAKPTVNRAWEAHANDTSREAAIHAAVLAEREECAVACDDLHHNWRWDDEPASDSGPRSCASSIRNRKESK